MLKGFSKYEEIRTEFGIVLPTTTTTTHTTHYVGTPGISVTMAAPTHVTVPAPTQATVITSTATISSLELRVAALEQANALLRAEFDAFKASQALQNQTFNNFILSLQGVSTHTSHVTVAAPAPAPAFPAPTHVTVSAPTPVPAPTSASVTISGPTSTHMTMTAPTFAPAPTSAQPTSYSFQFGQQ